MDPEEVEFFGEKSSVLIIPSFSYLKFYLIQGEIGPFRAGIPTLVPLWVAINLKKQHQCKIETPDWMKVDNLIAIKEAEKAKENVTKFTSLPENYMIEAKLILAAAPDDIPRADEVRTLIKDIWDIRMSKLRSSVDTVIKKTTMYAAVDNITLLEINSIRPTLPHALDQIYRIISSKNHLTGVTQGTTLSTTRTSRHTFGNTSSFSN